MNFSDSISLFSLEHFLVLFIIFGFLIFGFFYVKKNKNNKKKIHNFLLVLGILLLITWIGCRVSFVYHSIDEGIVEDFFGEKRL